MKNELLTIGPFTIYGYGLMIAIGIVAGCLTAEYRARKQGLDSEQIFPMILWCLVGGFLCAKLLFWITEWKSIAQDPGFMMETLSSGFVVFGGIIGGILTGFLYCRIKGLIFFKYADVILPSVALAQGFGRIGCFLAGCCYGKETESFFSVIFQNSEYAPNHVALIAAVFQRPGFPAFSSAVADCAEQKSRWPGDCLLSDLLQRRTFCDRVFPGRYYPGKCGDFVNFPVYQYFYRDCGDCAAGTGGEKKESARVNLTESGNFPAGCEKRYAMV